MLRTGILPGVTYAVKRVHNLLKSEMRLMSCLAGIVPGVQVVGQRDAAHRHAGAEQLFLHQCGAASQSLQGIV